MMLILRLASLLICCGFSIIHLVSRSGESRTIVAVKTNKMRYAKDEESGSKSMPLTHMLELASTSSKQQAILMPYTHNYNHNHKQQSNSFHEGKFLDDEDKQLLDDFYRDTKNSDPFISNGLSIESLWNEDDDRRERVGQLVGADRKEEVKTAAARKGSDEEQSNHNDWTFDSSIIDGLNGRPHEYNLGPIIEDSMRANYSPPLDLLTSYNPIQNGDNATEQQNGQIISKQIDLSQSSNNNNRIVGATLFGRDQNSIPNISSKSATEAIKLHNDMLQRPPNDGKVRVRMYYHRAIHDDTKLYGTGPWKYWGHGWGLEYGYDPRQKDEDFYQKGYSIERAFGRDFCKHNHNCRKSDPNFFQDPNSVGKYSEQYHKDIKKLNT